VITGIDSMEILDQAFAAVESFQPLSNDERETLLAKTRDAAATGRFEPFKTSSILTAPPRTRSGWVKSRLRFAS